MNKLSYTIIVAVAAAIIALSILYVANTTIMSQETVTQPTTSKPSNQTQSVVNQPPTTNAANESRGTVESSKLETQENITSIVESFKSYEELQDYIRETSITTTTHISLALPSFAGGSVVTYGAPPLTQAVTSVPTPIASPGQQVSVGEKGVFYSQTNVQVPGVDEADIVKTDGEYIYLARENQVLIIKAYPADVLSLESQINVSKYVVDGGNNNTSMREACIVRGIYLYENKLIVLVEESTYIPLPSNIIVEPLPIQQVEGNESNETKPTAIPVIVPPPYELIPTTHVLVFDIADKSSPKLLFNVSISGSYESSRMIDNYLYLISSMPTQVYDFANNTYVTLVPLVNGEKLPPEKILYFTEVKPETPVYTMILVVDVEKNEYNGQAIIQNYFGGLYVSLNNMYVLVEKGFDYTLIVRDILETILPKLPEDLRKDAEEVLSNNTSLNVFVLNKISNKLYQWFINLPEKERQQLIRKVYDLVVEKYYTIKTVIYKFSFKGLEVKPVAVGEVPGRILDQFAMDEYKGYFRIATTIDRPVLVNLSHYPYAIIEFNTTNNVYVLSENLSIIGKLEDIAPSEQIYSARFLGDILFLVTYRRVDPLFAINLSDPRKPEIIGYVKIPGYSEYLHPFKNNLLIGVGIETDENGRSIGLKISVFNISNLRDIREVSNIVFRDEYSTSPVLRDHRAFVLNWNENYMLIPVYTTMSPGIYKITIDPETGKLEVKGHLPLEYPLRALYIGEYVYGVGYYRIVVGDSGMNEIASMKIPGFQPTISSQP